jgi:hypothetical protein
LKHDGSNNFTGGTLAVPNAFTINSNSGNGTVTIAGNLQVDGTTTTVNTATMDVVDKNITIAKGSANDAAADGAGITIDSATDITLNFVDAKDAWVSSIGLEATTFLKAPYGHFTGSTTATTGSGVEVFAPDANTGQIQAYNRGSSAFNELRFKGASVGIYTGTSNAIVGTFNSTGLTMESGKTITGNVTGNLTGSVLTAAQTNITSVGTLTSLTVSGGGATIEGTTSHDGNVSSTTQFSGYDALRIHNANGSAFGVTADMYFTVGTGTTNRGAAIGVELESGNGGNDLYFATNPGSVTNNDTLVERLRIASDGQLSHTANRADQYTARFKQAHTSNPAWIEIDSPADSNVRPAYIQLQNAGTDKWGIGQVYASTSSGAFHLCAGAASEANSKLTLSTSGNLGIGSVNPNWPLTVQRSSGTAVIASKNTGGNATVYIEASNTNTAKLELTEAGTGSYSLQVGNDNALMFFDDADERMRITSSGHVIPGADNTQNLGSSTKRWANVYTADAHFNNIGTGGNDVDGTEGHWTMQEGADSMYLINRITGKKFKIAMTEVN